ncbi:MAG: c-type cytochrome [Sandaracinaceae bacterium]
MIIGGNEVGPVHYWKIWGILLGLLLISFVGPYAGIQVVTLATAFGIAVVKAYLVCKHFMHLDVQPKFVLYFLITALLFMGLFFFGVSPDVMEHEGQNWTNVAANDAVARGLAAEHGGEAGGVPAEWDAATEFANTCALCHGTAGAGDGVAAAGLDPHPANFTVPTFWQTRDRDHVINVITNGGAAVGRSATMVAFGGRFTPEQIEALADYVMQFNPGGEGAAPAPEGDTPAGDEAGDAAGTETGDAAGTEGTEAAAGDEAGDEAAGPVDVAPSGDDAADEPPAADGE